MRSIAPQIYSDELFSSWLVRTAHCYGCDPIVLTGHIWPKWRAWTIDIDRNLNVDQLKKLFIFLGKDVEYFNNSFLYQSANLMSKNPNKNASWPWIMPYGTRNRKHKGGLQFCPICLSTDKYPYFRKHWRFAWQTCCKKHSVQLLDKCPECNLAPQPHRVEAIEGNVKTCFNCKADLGKSKTFRLDNNAFSIQEECSSVLRTGLSRFGNIDSLQYFQVLKMFITVLNKCTLSKLSRLSEFLESYSIDIKNINPTTTGHPFEMLPVHERVTILSNVWKIIDNGPLMLKDKIKEYEVPITSLFGLINPLPRIILDIYGIDKMPEKRERKSPLKEKYAPQSKQSVMRMHARLKKKIIDLIIFE